MIQQIAGVGLLAVLTACGGGDEGSGSTISRSDLGDQWPLRT